MSRDEEGPIEKEILQKEDRKDKMELYPKSTPVDHFTHAIARHAEARAVLPFGEQDRRSCSSSRLTTMPLIVVLPRYSRQMQRLPCSVSVWLIFRPIMSVHMVIRNVPNVLETSSEIEEQSSNVTGTCSSSHNPLVPSATLADGVCWRSGQSFDWSAKVLAGRRSGGT